MTKASPDQPKRKRRFTSTASLIAPHLRAASEGRGFAISRLLTQWREIVGPDIARMARPVRMSHRSGMGGTLILLTTGPQAPIVEMAAPKIRDRVNACYGFNAVARVKVTQTAPEGFSEGQVAFEHKSKATPRRDPALYQGRAQQLTDQIEDRALRDALARLACNLLSRWDSEDRKET